MIPLSLNLATRPWYNRRLFNTVLSAAVLCQLLLTLIGGSMVLHNTRAFQRMKDETRRLEEQLTRQRSGLSQKELARHQEKLEGINVILERRSRQHWLLQLDELEGLVPDGVALTRLEPDSKAGLTLNGRCKGFTDLQRLMENLAKSSRFTDVVLISHSTLSTPGQPSLLQFVVSVGRVSR